MIRLKEIAEVRCQCSTVSGLKMILSCRYPKENPCCRAEWIHQISCIPLMSKNQHNRLLIADCLIPRCTLTAQPQPELFGFLSVILYHNSQVHKYILTCAQNYRWSSDRWFPHQPFQKTGELIDDLRHPSNFPDRFERETVANRYHKPHFSDLSTS